MSNEGNCCNEIKSIGQAVVELRATIDQMLEVLKTSGVFADPGILDFAKSVTSVGSNSLSGAGLAQFLTANPYLIAAGAFVGGAEEFYQQYRAYHQREESQDALSRITPGEPDPIELREAINLVYFNRGNIDFAQFYNNPEGKLLDQNAGVGVMNAMLQNSQELIDGGYYGMTVPNWDVFLTTGASSGIEGAFKILLEQGALSEYIPEYMVENINTDALLPLFMEDMRAAFQQLPIEEQRGMFVETFVGEDIGLENFDPQKIDEYTKSAYALTPDSIKEAEAEKWKQFLPLQLSGISGSDIVTQANQFVLGNIPPYPYHPATLLFLEGMEALTLPNEQDRETAGAGLEVFEGNELEVPPGMLDAYSIQMMQAVEELKIEQEEATIETDQRVEEVEQKQAEAAPVIESVEPLPQEVEQLTQQLASVSYQVMRQGDWLSALSASVSALAAQVSGISAPERTGYSSHYGSGNATAD